MGYQQTQYGKYQYATVQYGWSYTGVIALNLTDTISCLDFLSYTETTGLADQVGLQEWFDIKLTGPIWTDTAPAATTWTTNTPATTVWTTQAPASTTWTPTSIAPEPNPWEILP